MILATLLSGLIQTQHLPNAHSEFAAALERYSQNRALAKDLVKWMLEQGNIRITESSNNGHFVQSGYFHYLLQDGQVSSFRLFSNAIPEYFRATGAEERNVNYKSAWVRKVSQFKVVQDSPNIRWETSVVDFERTATFNWLPKHSSGYWIDTPTPSLVLDVRTGVCISGAFPDTSFEKSIEPDWIERGISDEQADNLIWPVLEGADYLSDSEVRMGTLIGLMGIVNQKDVRNESLSELAKGRKRILLRRWVVIPRHRGYYELDLALKDGSPSGISGFEELGYRSTEAQGQKRKKLFGEASDASWRTRVSGGWFKIKLVEAEFVAASKVWMLSSLNRLVLVEQSEAGDLFKIDGKVYRKTESVQ